MVIVFLLFNVYVVTRYFVIAAHRKVDYWVTVFSFYRGKMLIMFWQNIGSKLLIYDEFVVLVLFWDESSAQVFLKIGNGNELSWLVVHGKIEIGLSKSCLVTKSNDGG